MFNPPVLILVNSDLTDNVIDYLKRQLFLDKVLDGYAWAQELENDPNIKETIKIKNQRIMVYKNLLEQENRDIFDLVLFISKGQIYVLFNKFGPPGISYSITKLTWNKLGFS